MCIISIENERATGHVSVVSIVYMLIAMLASAALTSNTPTSKPKAAGGVSDPREGYNAERICCSIWLDR